jgi:hypothetical protein
MHKTTLIYAKVNKIWFLILKNLVSIYIGRLVCVELVRLKKCWPKYKQLTFLVFTPTFIQLTHSTHTNLPMKMEQIECSETSAYKIQTPGNYTEENIEQQIWLICIFKSTLCYFQGRLHGRNTGFQTAPAVNCSNLTVRQFTDQCITIPNVLCNA